MSIPFSTLSQKHTVYAYVVVWVLQFGYALWLYAAWRRTRPPQ
ncbi:MAG: hypothetical protein PW792_05705 [Acidobacteriaceae bacterium]|nr:hypothetical protein [Acidobacteriaceae bacterium]